MRDGAVTIGIGAFIGLVGLGLTAATNGQRVFVGAMAVGGVYVLIGLFKLARGAIRS